MQSTKRPDRAFVIKKKDFDVGADQSVKIKEIEMLDKYLNLFREQKKLRNIKVTLVLIEFGALGTIP